VALIVVNPRRLTRQTRLSRVASLALVALIGLANAVALIMLLHVLLASEVPDGRALLVAALQVWLTNVIVFGWPSGSWTGAVRSSAPRSRANS
jgi:hypothetical protein